MNSLARKILIVLFAVMLGTSLVAPHADAVGHCIGSMCSHCDFIMPPMSESIPAAGFNGQMCDSSFTTSPCSLNTHPDSNTKIFTVTSTEQNRQKAGGSFTFAVSGTSLVQNAVGNGKIGQLRITSDTIPIYLRNLSFLC
jgi:hypothetical protein